MHICTLLICYVTNLLSFFFQAIQNTFRLKEITNSCYQQLDEERKRRATAVQTLTIAENSNVELKKKLTAEEQAQRSADLALEGAKRQAESQRKLASEAQWQLQDFCLGCSYSTLKKFQVISILNFGKYRPKFKIWP